MEALVPAAVKEVTDRSTITDPEVIPSITIFSSYTDEAWAIAFKNCR